MIGMKVNKELEMLRLRLTGLEEIQIALDIIDTVKVHLREQGIDQFNWQRN